MQQLAIGTLLRGGTYKIEKVLGQGSFGITYLAEHTGLKRKVAIKEFFMKELNSRGDDGSITGMTDGSLSHSYCAKFRKEAVNLSRLDHPNIVRVTDSFSENGTFYYVMEYIEGQNLNDYVKTHHVDEKEAVSIIKYVTDALIYMHESQHMLHLDLKPGNVMRRESDGHIFLIDFGLSKHFCEDGQPETSTTIGLGTPGYAPIEQGNRAKNGEFRPTIDVYALGATFYKLLTGETPPAASDLVSDDELLEGNLRAKGVSENLIKVVTAAMCPNVKKRTQTIRDFKNNIANVCPATSSTITSNTENEDISQEVTIVTADVDDALPKQSVETNATVADANMANNIIDNDIPQKHSIFSFQGRVGRLTYWLVSILSYFALFLIYIPSLFVETNTPIQDYVYICAIIVVVPLFYYVPLAVGAKRCHDLGHSGWFQIIPFYCLVMLFSRGDPYTNKYGEKRNKGISNKSLKLLGGIVGAIYITAFVGSFLLGEDKAKLYSEAEDIIEGHIIENGILLPGDSVKALPLIQKLAEKQYGPALWMLAQYYENGSAGIQKDQAEAERLLEQAFTILQEEAEKGDMYSQCALSIMYSSGNRRLNIDNAKAFTWMQKSAEQGYGDALNNLASLYLNGIGCIKNDQKAFQCMQKAAEVNKDNGEMLAAMYLQGIGTKADTSKAISIYKELADMHSSSSQAQLGHIYFEQDKYDLAFKYLSEAEEKDELQAITDLAVMYWRGLGVTENQDKAKTLAQRSVELSNRDPFCLFLLGVIYEEKDNTKAFTYVKESAENGEPSAQYRLAVYYQQGVGVKANENLAYKWYKKALANGYKE